jgi:hypothetical protein
VQQLDGLAERERHRRHSARRSWIRACTHKSRLFGNR